MAAEAALVPTPLSVLPMAADVEENALAPIPIAAPPVLSDNDAGVLDPPELPADVLVPMPVADPQVTAEDADDVFITRTTLASPPPEQKNAYVTGAEGEVPSQAEIDKASECINDLLIPTFQKSCGMVTDIKENETSHCSSDLPSNDDGETNHGATHKQQEESVRALEHSVSGDQQPMAAFDGDVQKSGTQQPLPCPSDQQQNPTLGCERNDESQDVSRADSDEKLTPLEMKYMMWQRGLMDPYMRMMRNQYVVDEYFRGLRFRSNRNIDDHCGHSDESDHTHDGDPWRFEHQFNHHDAHHQIGHGRGRRIGCRCHCKDQGYHRNSENPCWPGSDPYYPMAIARQRWSPSKLDRGHMGRWYSPKPDLEKEKYIVGAALLNPDLWTCFLNCILQCMVHTVPLVLKLQEADHPDPCPRACIGFCCYCSLKLHTNESIERSGSAFYPMRFVDRLRAISPDFVWRVQQDVQELLRCLLDKLDEASVAPRSSEEPSSTEGGIAKEVFGGLLKSQLHCSECNHCSDRSEPFLDLSLEINMVETLTNALESFTKVEVIEDVMCDGCKSRVNMEKYLKIEQAPEVLVIHLKRFLNSGDDILKILDKVKYTLELDIAPFMCSIDDTPQKYDLYGVVEHQGAYARGHYVCYIRSSQTYWYKFDDEKVSRYSEEEVLDITSYLLFYVKKGSYPWFSSLLEKKKIPLDGSAEAERGPDELHKDKEESTSSDGQDGSDGLCKPVVNGNGPSLVGDANGNTLSDELEQLSCSLRRISGEAQELSCVTGSDGKNGHVDIIVTEPLEMKEDGSPRGSPLDRKEMKGSTEEDNRGTQVRSPGKNDNTFSLLGRTSPEPFTNSSLHEDQKVPFSGAPLWTCSSENKATVESSDSDKEDEPTTALERASANSYSAGEDRGAAGKKRKHRKARSADDASRRHKRRKKRAVARQLYPFGRRLRFSVKSKRRW